MKHFPCIMHNLEAFLCETFCYGLKNIICVSLEILNVSISKYISLKKSKWSDYSPQRQISHLRKIMITYLNVIVILFSASFWSSIAFGMYKPLIPWSLIYWHYLFLNQNIWKKKYYKAAAIGMIYRNITNKSINKWSVF